MTLGSRKISFLLLLVLVTANAGITPSSLLNFLNSIAGQHTISGQFIEFGPLDPIEAIYKNTGKWLGMIGGDYWWFGSTQMSATYSFNPIAADYFSAGGLITLTCSMPNPTTGGYSGDVSYLNVNDLFTTGTTTNNNFNSMLDSIAQGLQDLHDSGVVVIFRPFHENNGNWFWWGTTFLSDQQFISMWQYVHSYFTNTTGLDNLLWLYAVNTGIGGDTSRFAGDEYVDIVGQDLYTSDPTQGKGDFATLLSLGKPVVIAEFGAGGPGQGDTSFNETTLIAAIKGTMPQTVFWQQWWDGNGDNTGWGMAEVQDAAGALNDPWVLNRGDIGAFFD